MGGPEIEDGHPDALQESGIEILGIWDGLYLLRSYIRPMAGGSG